MRGGSGETVVEWRYAMPRSPFERTMAPSVTATGCTPPLAERIPAPTCGAVLLLLAFGVDPKGSDSQPGGDVAANDVEAASAELQESARLSICQGGRVCEAEEKAGVVASYSTK